MWQRKHVCIMQTYDGRLVRHRQHILRHNLIKHYINETQPLQYIHKLDVISNLKGS